MLLCNLTLIENNCQGIAIISEDGLYYFKGGKRSPPFSKIALHIGGQAVT